MYQFHVVSIVVFMIHKGFFVFQLQSFLFAYIAKNGLADRMNPLTIYCKEDPLGNALGVEKFFRKESM